MLLEIGTFCRPLRCMRLKPSGTSIHWCRRSHAALQGSSVRSKCGIEISFLGRSIANVFSRPDPPMLAAPIQFKHKFTQPNLRSRLHILPRSICDDFHAQNIMLVIDPTSTIHIRLQRTIVFVITTFYSNPEPSGH